MTQGIFNSFDGGLGFTSADGTTNDRNGQLPIRPGLDDPYKSPPYVPTIPGSVIYDADGNPIAFNNSMSPYNDTLDYDVRGPVYMGPPISATPDGTKVAPPYNAGSVVPISAAAPPVTTGMSSIVAADGTIFGLSPWVLAAIAAGGFLLMQSGGKKK